MITVAQNISDIFRPTVNFSVLSSDDIIALDAFNGVTFDAVYWRDTPIYIYGPAEAFELVDAARKGLAAVAPDVSVLKQFIADQMAGQPELEAWYQDFVQHEARIFADWTALENDSQPGVWAYLTPAMAGYLAALAGSADDIAAEFLKKTMSAAKEAGGLIESLLDAINLGQVPAFVDTASELALFGVAGGAVVATQLSDIVDIFDGFSKLMVDFAFLASQPSISAAGTYLQDVVDQLNLLQGKIDTVLIGRGLDKEGLGAASFFVKAMKIVSDGLKLVRDDAALNQAIENGTLSDLTADMAQSIHSTRIAGLFGTALEAIGTFNNDLVEGALGTYAAGITTTLGALLDGIQGGTKGHWAVEYHSALVLLGQDGRAGVDDLANEYAALIQTLLEKMGNIPGGTDILNNTATANPELVNALILGDSSDNHLVGTETRNDIQGLIGADTLEGMASRDTLRGGDGNDRLDAGGGDDSLSGDDGDDVVYGGYGADTMFGGIGNDTLDGGASSDLMLSGDGDDLLVMDRASDRAHGGAGNDTLMAALRELPSGVQIDLTGDAVRINGNAIATGVERVSLALGIGDDHVTAGLQLDLIDGGGGVNTLHVDYSTASSTQAAPGSVSLKYGTIDHFLQLYYIGGVSWLTSYQWVDVWRDTTAVDVTLADGSVVHTEFQHFQSLDVTATAGNDYVHGRELSDTVRGMGGDDNVYGWLANDSLDGGSGNDTLDGGDGNDDVIGGDGHDVLYGGADADTVDGGAGNDTLNGNGGADVLSGGLDDDYVYLDQTGDRASGDGGTDTLDANLGDMILGAQVEVIGDGLIIDGLAVAVGFERFVVTAGQGNDTITAGRTVAVVNGAGGSDVLRLDYSAEGAGGAVQSVNLVYGVTHQELRWGGPYYNPYTYWVNQYYPHTGVTMVLADGTTLGAEFQNVESFDLTASAGNDFVQGRELGDTLRGIGGNDSLYGLTGDDSLYGGEGNDGLEGGEGTDTLDGGAGNDTLNGVTGADVMSGGLDDDYLYMDQTGDRASGDGGNDTLNANLGDLVLGTQVEVSGDALSVDDLTIATGVEHIILTAGQGNDTVTAGFSGDLLNGGAGQDVLRLDYSGLAANGHGAQSISLVFGYTVYELRYGGPYYNPYTYWVNQFYDHTVVTLTLDDGSTVGTQFQAFEFFDLTATSGNDYVQGRDMGDTLRGLGGEDSLFGLTGNDSLTAGDGNDMVDGGAGNDTLDGGAQNDVLNGGTGADIVSGGEGDDYVSLGALGDLASGDGGNDTLNATMDDMPEGAQITLLADGLMINGQIVATGFETVILTGGQGNDTITAGFAKDLQNGGNGADVLRLNYSGQDAAGMTASAITLRYGTYHFQQVIIGYSIGGNPAYGWGNVWYSHTAATITLADGSTVATEFQAFEALDVTATAGGDHVEGRELGDTLRGNGGEDSLYGLIGNDSLTGGAANDLLDGGGDNDTLAGGIGDNVLLGGSGDDLYIIRSGGDLVFETTLAYGATDAGGIDTVQTSVSVDLDAYDGVRFVEKLTLTGTANLNATGNALANLLFGNAGSNILNGGLGSDKMVGGAGNDIYVVNAGGDRVFETTNMSSSVDAGGVDTVLSAVTFNLAENAGTQFVENLTLTGTGNFSATGNDLANLLIGGAGNNTLNGGLGADRMIGGAGDDVYVVDSTADRVFETLSATSFVNAGGLDWVSSAVNFNLDAYEGVRFVERLTLTGAANINATGNALANQLFGNAGANLLNGGMGADTLTGGDGSDSFTFSHALVAGEADVITDFSVVDDMLRLDDAIFVGLARGTLSPTAFVANDTGLATTANDRIIYETDSGRLYYDSDGLGGAGRQQFAKLDVYLALTNADFLVY